MRDQSVAYLKVRPGNERVLNVVCVDEFVFKRSSKFSGH